MKSYRLEHEHELMRRKTWCDAWAATVSACKSSLSATAYADEALKAFDARFPPLKNLDEPA